MNFALNLAANRLSGITIAWSPDQPWPSSSQTAAQNLGMLSDPHAAADSAGQQSPAQESPTLESEEARLEPLLVAGGVSPATRAAALEQFQAQLAQDAAMIQPVSALRPQNRARAATTLERQDQVLAGLLIGSPEFQRR
jgi:hypothetical protein